MKIFYGVVGQLDNHRVAAPQSGKPLSLCLPQDWSQGHTLLLLKLWHLGIKTWTCTLIHGVFLGRWVAPESLPFFDLPPYFSHSQGMPLSTRPSSELGNSFPCVPACFSPSVRFLAAPDTWWRVWEARARIQLRLALAKRRHFFDSQSWRLREDYLGTTGCRLNISESSEETLFQFS